MVYSNNEISFGNGQEWSKWYTNEPWKHYAKWKKKPDTKVTYCGITFILISRISKSIEAESRLVIVNIYTNHWIVHFICVNCMGYESHQNKTVEK